MIFPDMWAVLGFDAFAGHTRADDFRQTIDVYGINATAQFNFLAHRIGPGLRTEYPDPERGFRWINPLAIKLIGKIQHIRGRGHDDAGLEILNQLHLALGHDRPTWE